MIETKLFDSADYLKTEEDFVEYLNEILATEDVELFAHALGVIARAKGMPEAAVDAEGRESRPPEFATMLRILGTLGLRLSAEKVEAAA